MVIHFAMSFFNTYFFALVAFLSPNNTVKGSQDMFLRYKGGPTHSHLLASKDKVREGFQKKPVESVGMLIPPSNSPTVSALGYFFATFFWII